MQTKPHVSRAFAQGATFGAGALVLFSVLSMATGAGALFAPALAWPVMTAALDITAASLIGMMTAGPLFAATNLLTHTIPGLSSLLGEEKSAYSELTRKKGRHGHTLPSPDKINIEYIKHAEQQFFAPDLIRDESHVARLEAEREMAEAAAQEAATAQR